MKQRMVICLANDSPSGRDALLCSAFTFGTKSGMESEAHVRRSLWLCPGWIPKAGSKMASLVQQWLQKVQWSEDVIKAVVTKE